MRRSLAIAGLFLGWLCAQGSLLDSAQMFAWARMFAGYAETMSFRQAAAETFNPEKPCALCCAIRKARQSESHAPSAPIERDMAKIDLVFVAPEDAPAVVTVSELFFRSDHRVPTDWDPVVPTPPPRARAWSRFS